MKQHTWWRCVLAAVLPAVVVLALIAALFQAGPREFIPVWSDEVIYWKEAAVFAEAGFDGGYSIVHERPATAAFSRFGPKGPLYAAFQGTIGRLAGWHPSSPFLINLVIVSGAAYAWLRRGTAGASPATWLLLASFWPMLLYLPTNMQEPLHFAFAFLFALAVDRWQRVPGRRLIAATALLLVVASVIRPTWALMLLPIGWRRAREHGIVAVAALVGATLVAAAAAQAAFDFLGSPYPNSLEALMSIWSDDRIRAIGFVGQHASRNVAAWLAPGEDEPPEVVFRYFTIGLAVLLLVRSAGRLRPVRHGFAIELALGTLLPALAVTILFGWVESWRDFRLMAPPVLAALLLLAAHGGWERWLWAGTLALLPLYHAEFVEFHEQRFTSSHVDIVRMQWSTATAMPFEPGASPWANTLLVHAGLLQYPLLGIPRGIGVSYVLDWSDVPTPIRSGYLLLRPEDREAIGPRVALAPLVETPLGTLYRNGGAPPEVRRPLDSDVIEEQDVRLARAFQIAQRR